MFRWGFWQFELARLVGKCPVCWGSVGEGTRHSTPNGDECIVTLYELRDEGYFAGISGKLVRQISRRKGTRRFDGGRDTRNGRG
jgi:hypothetical protein